MPKTSRAKFILAHFPAREPNGPRPNPLYIREGTPKFNPGGFPSPWHWVGERREGATRFASQVAARAFADSCQEFMSSKGSPGIAVSVVKVGSGAPDRVVG